jgi:hypothetical protein
VPASLRRIFSDADKTQDKFNEARGESTRLRTALERIAEYDVDWTKGPAANVNALQAIAEAALHPPVEAPAWGWSGVPCSACSPPTPDTTQGTAPTCAPWCSRPYGWSHTYDDTPYLSGNVTWCTPACRDAGRPLNPASDTVKRPPGCKCHREEGDSECPIHDAASPEKGTGEMPAPAVGQRWRDTALLGSPALYNEGKPFALVEHTRHGWEDSATQGEYWPDNFFTNGRLAYIDTPPARPLNPPTRDALDDIAATSPRPRSWTESPMMAVNPPCPTCHDEGKVLHFYNRGPGDPPGNMMIPCPTCHPTPVAP